MKRLTADATFTLILLAVAVLLLVLTLQFSASARRVPLIVIVLLTLLLTYRLVRALTSGVSPNEAESRPGHEAVAAPRSELAMIAWVLALPVLGSVLGFVAGPAAFVFAWTAFRARERIWIAVAAALFTGVAVWLAFERLLGMPLPAGAWRALLNA